MPFDIAGARKEGYTDDEIADYLAGQNGFDIAGARKEGYSAPEIVEHLAGAIPAQPQAQAPTISPPAKTPGASGEWAEDADEPWYNKFFKSISPTAGMNLTEADISGAAGGAARGVYSGAKAAGSAVKNLPFSIARKVGAGVEAFGDVAGSMRINPQMPEQDITEATERATGGLPQGDNLISRVGREAADTHGEILRAATPEFRNPLDRHVYNAVLSAGETISTLPANLVIPGSSLALMGAGAGADEYHDLVRSGVAKPKAAIGAAVNAGIEIVTEKLPLDYLTKSFGTPFKQYLIGMMVREVPTELAATAGQLAENAWATSDTLGEATAKYKKAIGPALIDTAIQTPLSAGLQAGAVRLATKAADPFTATLERIKAAGAPRKAQPAAATQPPLIATGAEGSTGQAATAGGLEIASGEVAQNEPPDTRRLPGNEGQRVRTQGILDYAAEKGIPATPELRTQAAQAAMDETLQNYPPGTPEFEQYSAGLDAFLQGQGYDLASLSKPRTAETSIRDIPGGLPEVSQPGAATSSAPAPTGRAGLTPQPAPSSQFTENELAIMADLQGIIGQSRPAKKVGSATWETDERGDPTGEVFVEPSLLPAHLKNQGITRSKGGTLDLLDRALAGKQLTATQKSKILDLAEHHSREAYGKAMNREEIPVSELQEGQEFTRDGEKYKVTDVEDGAFPWEKKVTIKDGITFTMEGDELIDADRGSVKPAHWSEKLFKGKRAPGATVKESLSVPPVYEQTYEEGGVAEKGELDLGLNQGTDLRAPERENRPVTMDELPLGRATNEAADREKQGGLFEKVKDAYKRSSLSSEGGSLGEKPIAPAFYSKAESIIKQFLPENASPQSVRDLMKQHKVKADDLAHSGIEEFLAEKPGKISKSDLMAFMQEKQAKIVPVEFGRKKLSDSEQDVVDDLNRQIAEWNDQYHDGKITNKEFQSMRDKLLDFHGYTRRSLLDASLGDSTKFDNWKIPGESIPGSYVEHFETVPEEGKGGLSESERIEWERMQDDKISNGQVNRGDVDLYNSLVDKAYRDRQDSWKDGHSPYDSVKNPIVRWRGDGRTTADGHKTFFVHEIQAPSPENQAKMPKWAQKRWREIGLKSALDYAVKNGYDSLSLATGEQVAGLYDLSKHIKRISYLKDSAGTYDVAAYDLNSVRVMNESSVDAKRLEEFIGKDIANKIISAERTGWQELSGLDLKVGGEGIKKLYDHDLPGILNDLGKKFGQKTEKTTMNLSGIKDSAEQQEALDVARRHENKVFEERNFPQITTLKIPPSMRSDVRHKGQELYSGIPIDVLIRDIKRMSPHAKEAAAKVYELGRRIYESGKTSWETFSFAMQKRMGGAWFRLKGMVQQAWERLKGINEKLGERGITEARQPKKSNLNAFQREQVATPEFKDWFGDSKVVDENGEPLVVYHGTDQAFSQFDISKAGGRTGAGSGRVGFFFSNDPSISETYTGMASGQAAAAFSAANNEIKMLRIDKKEFAKKYGMRPEDAVSTKKELLNEGLELDEIDAITSQSAALPESAKKEARRMADRSKYLSKLSDSAEAAMRGGEGDREYLNRQYGPNIQPVYLAIKNPLVIDFEGKPRDISFKAALDKAKADGHDGAIFKNVHDPKLNDVYIAFSEEQIKSATGNSGAFDSKNPVITASFPAGPILQAIKAAKDAKAAYPHLVDLGQGVMREGQTKFFEWKAAMKKHLGDMWDGFKHLMEKVYFAAKLANKKLGERGAIGEDGKRLTLEQWKKAVGDALAEGKPVPQRVIDDFVKRGGKVPGKVGSDEGGNIAAGGLAFGMDLPKYAAGNSSVNLKRIDAGYPVKFLINQVAEQYKGKIDEARRGTITHEATRKLADEFGMTEEQLLKRRKGQAFNAEQALGARDVLNTSAARLVEAQKKAVESGSDDALVEFRIALSRHATIQAEVSAVATEAGRALSAHRILSQEITQQAKNQKAVLDALGGRDMTEEILNRMKSIDMNDMASVNRFIREFATVKKSDMIFEAWVNFLLSGPKTHIVNSLSNTITFLTKIPETAVTSGIEVVRSTVTGKPRERFWHEVHADAVGMYTGLTDGVAAAVKAFKEEMPSDRLMKLEEARYKAIPGKTGEIIRIPGRFLIAEDEFFKTITYTAERYRLAYRKARKEGYKGKELTAKTAEYVQRPTLEIKEAAKEEARYRTFTQEYGKYSRTLDKLRRIPGARYIVPFLRTPTNIAKFALERTPLNFARLGYKAAKGDLKGAALSDELAKPILGSLIGASIVALAQAGLATGGGPKDKEERDALFRAGWRPYSLKIGGKYYGYGRLEPLGSIFGMASDFSELAANTDGKELSDYAESIALSISKNLSSKTFLTGVSNAMDALSDPKRYGENWIENFSGTVVPSLVNAVAKMTDEKRREIHSPWDAIKARTPYLSASLLPKRDLWGREIVQDGGWIQRGFSPIVVSEDSKDAVDQEMLRLYKSIKYAPGLPQRRIKGEKLTPAQYDLYLGLSGQKAYTEVKELIGEEYYRNADDHDKAEKIQRKIEQARGEIRRKIAKKNTKEESE